MSKHRWITQCLPPSRTVHERSNRQGPVGCQALAKALRANRTVTSLAICGNAVGDAGVAALAAALTTDNNTLVELYASQNTVGTHTCMCVCVRVCVCTCVFHCTCVCVSVVRMQTHGVVARPLCADSRAPKCRLSRRLCELTMCFVCPSRNPAVQGTRVARRSSRCYTAIPHCEC